MYMRERGGEEEEEDFEREREEGKERERKAEKGRGREKERNFKELAQKHLKAGKSDSVGQVRRKLREE